MVEWAVNHRKEGSFAAVNDDLKFFTQ